MRHWNLEENDPLNLVIAADASLTSTSYVDDQIWELSIGGGEPSALALSTTYGLRANLVRLFPQFSDGSILVSDPRSFTESPVIKKILPNYLQVAITPVPDIDVILEYLVPHSQGCCGRISFTNTTDHQKTIQSDWIGLLFPRNGKRFAHQEIEAVHTLSGATENICPVFFLTGGAQPGQGPYPSLSISFDLNPGEKYHIMWAHAALTRLEDSFQLARSLAALKWDAEIARTELNFSRKLDIRTDDVNWDAAIMLTQKLALGLIHSPTKHLPNPSFVLSRVPDQGFSGLEDGSDYNFLWNGQTALDTLFLSGFLLPSDLPVAQGIFNNFLAIQETNGFIDWKPGLGGQRSHILTTPVLATLAHRIYEVSQDRTFLEHIFEPLLRYYKTWFSNPRDVDKDGIPEWEHLLQTALDDHPKYASWSIDSDGLDITTIESPGLLSLLYKEGIFLAEFAAILGKDKEQDDLSKFTQFLKKNVGKFYNPLKHVYSDRDRDTHTSTPGTWIWANSGNGETNLTLKLTPKSRLVISILSDGSHICRPIIKIYGKDKNRKAIAVTITSQQFKWFLGRGIHTTRDVFSFVKKIIIDENELTDTVSVKTADFGFTDITQYLPLWAGIPDQAIADEIVSTCLQQSGGLLSEHGLKTYSVDVNQADLEISAVIHPIWMTFFLEGLLNYGYRFEAADLMTRYIQLIIKQLRSEKAFRHNYLAQTGAGVGEKNHLHGIIPIDCFLRILGVNFLNDFQVRIEGYNPFPWVVKVNYLGITVVKQTHMTTIVFPDGQTTQISEPDPRVVSWEHDRQSEN